MAHPARPHRARHLCGHRARRRPRRLLLRLRAHYPLVVDGLHWHLRLPRPVGQLPGRVGRASPDTDGGHRPDRVDLAALRWAHV
eukprot:scaffold7284_cov115-Isochrysis_galbana.AAC.1